MKKFILCLLLATAPILAVSVYAQDDYEYVFTESELRAFLEENIAEAVDKAVAEITRVHLIQIAVEKNAIANRDALIISLRSEITGLEKELRSQQLKFLFTGIGIGVGSLAVGVLVGILAF